MDLGQFVDQLTAGGHVRVARDEPALGEALRALQELDAAARNSAPATAPPFDAEAAQWAARMLYRAAACVTFRDLDDAAIGARLAQPCPRPTTAAATHWSVDLALQHLPALFGLARGVASADPLLVHLRRLARDWPLSAVGIADLGAVDATAVLADDCLRTIYLDRVLAADARDHAADPRVRRALATALGAHPELAGPRTRAVLQVTP